MKRLVILCLLVATTAAAAPPPLDAKTKQLVFDIYKQLIEINTTDSIGNNTTAAQAMAARLKAAGFPAADVQVLAPNPRKGNLVARLHGTGKEKPLLLLAHLDVVEAKREDWSMDPFVLTEKDGYYYGRGTSDDKAMAAIWIATLIRFTWIDKPKPSAPSPLTPAVMKPIAEVSNEFWPGTPVLPLMSAGASDGLYLRNAGIPTYGVSGLFGELSDSRAHGKDERVRVDSFYDSAQFLYVLAKRLAS